MIERNVSRLALALALVVGGCTPAAEESSASAPASASASAPAAEEAAAAAAKEAAGAPTGGAPVRVITHTYLPRVIEQDYVEEVSLAAAGDAFNLLVTPRVKTPREGPWLVTFRGPEGESKWRRGEPVRVDTVTGGVTFLVQTAAVAPGEWTIEFDLSPGGLTHGPERQVFRFRVAP